MADKWRTLLDQHKAIRDDYGVSTFADQGQGQSGKLFALDHLACLLVQGPDARKFLQGQVTCDMDQLSLERSVTGGHCNTRGRLLFSFRAVLLEAGADGETIALVMHRGLVAQAQAALAKFIVFSKATLAADDKLRVLGLAGIDTLEHFPLPAAEINAAAINENGSLVRLGDHRVLCLLEEEAAIRLWESATNTFQLHGWEQWKLEEIRAGHSHVLPGSEDMFIPQMLNMQLTGGVSFTKGCYVGQEVVARMQYLGRLKRRMRRLQLQSSNLPAAGAPLYTEGSMQSVGNVVLAAPSDQHLELLAVVTDEAFGNNALYLDQEGQQKLSLLDLPYSIDQE